MKSPRQLYEESGDFFSREADKIITKMVNSKNEKERRKFTLELEEIKKRILLELNMLEKFIDENDDLY
jgi:Fe2+ transport system protein B